MDRRGFVDYDELEFFDRDGKPIDVFDRHGNELDVKVPVVFRWACRNSRCCPRREGMVGVHRATLYGVQNDRPVGEVETRYEPTRPLNELIDLLPPERVRHIG